MVSYSSPGNSKLRISTHWAKCDWLNTSQTENRENIQLLSTSEMEMCFQEGLNEAIEFIFVIVKHWNPGNRCKVAIVQNWGYESIYRCGFSQESCFLH